MFITLAIRKPISILLVFSKTDDSKKLARCVDSLREDYLAGDQIVLMVNGGAGSIVRRMPELADWKENLNCSVVNLFESKGFGDALNVGLSYCKHQYIMRIDPDDVSIPGRVESQVAVLEKDRTLAVCGGWAGEMYDGSMSISLVRETPLNHAAIARQAKFKNPICHVSVIMRKNLIESVGGYPQSKKGQDYLLWVKLLLAGFRLVNIDKVVVWVDYTDNFGARRGYSFFKNEVAIFFKMWQLGFIKAHILLFNIISRFFLRNSPIFIREAVYKIKSLRGTRGVE